MIPPIKAVIDKPVIKAVLKETPEIMVSKIPAYLAIPRPDSITSISVNGEPLPIIDHNVNIIIPIYTAGNGIVINDQYEISLDELIIDCGTSTTVL